MQRITIVESERTTVSVSKEQAVLLDVLGKKLASQSGWWGADEERVPGSVIDVSQAANSERTILVREAVGVVAIDGLEIVVLPKIPYRHFLYLANESQIVPRIEAKPTEIDPAASLWAVMAHWFMQAVEQLLRRELAKGYRETWAELERSRGRILPLETARAYYLGRPLITCEFEEFSEDIALNRLLKAAADLVASSPVSMPLRQRARRALARMTDVGVLQHSDFLAEVDRLTRHYGSAISFAKYLLRHGGTKVAHGAMQGWCFLIRTPELVEAGVRAVLRRGLAPNWRVHKQGKAISGAGLTINPDLVFDSGRVVGDVKHKILDSDWTRSDLYQCVAFATGFEARAAVLVGFRDTSGGPLPPAVQFGRVLVEAHAWDARNASDPEESAKQLCCDIASSLKRASPNERGLLEAAAA